MNNADSNHSDRPAPWAPPSFDDDVDPGSSTATRSVSSRSRRTGLAAGITAGLLGGAAAGLVFGVPGSTSAAVDDTSERAAAVAQVDDTDNATDNGAGSTTDAVTDEDRLAERTERIRTALDDLVANGTITADQADAVAAHMAEQAPERGHHGPRGGPGRHLDGTVLELLDIDAETLRDALQGGSTLAEVAEFSGVSSDELIDALVEQAMERLDEAVDSGRLTEEEAADKAAELEERITERVNDPSPGPRGERGGPDASGD